MIKKKYFGLVMGTQIMLALGFAMSIVVQLLTEGKVTFFPLLVMGLQAFVVNFVAGLIIPTNKIGDMVAVKLGLEVATFKFMAVNTFVVSFIFVTIVSFFMTAINVGLNPVLIPACLSTFPIMVAVGYLVAIALTPVALKITRKLVAEVEE